MSDARQYAIIDGAIEAGLLDFLSQHNPPHCCLYAEPLAQSLVALAPYLVEVTAEVANWLENKSTPWGIYLFTPAVMKDLRHHLRKYLQIIIPSEEKPVFFRFYDPRNIWDFCHVLTEWELHCFLGPIEKITVISDGTVHEESFLTERMPFPKMAQGKFKLFKINQSQLDALNQRAEEKYIDNLVQHALLTDSDKFAFALRDFRSINALYDNSTIEREQDLPLSTADAAKKIVSDCFYFCKARGIEDDRSIRGMLHLLTEKHVFWTEKLPVTWQESLNNTTLPGYYRVESLLKQELGYIPR